MTNVDTTAQSPAFGVRGLVAPGLAAGLYAATLFVSALLLFAVQPMFTKMVLPKLGGSPAVWSTAMVAFQAFLFAGYLYAHVISRTLTPVRAAMVHLAVLAAVAVTLPLGIAQGFDIPPSSGITFWLIALFAASIGAPFVALSASAPLLQNWFIATGHPMAKNPYVLYAASNLGSFAGLLAYPFLIEPFFTLQTQTAIWMHVSNRHMELASVVAAVGAEERLVAYHRQDDQANDFLKDYRANAEVVVLAQSASALGDLPQRYGWKTIAPRRDVPAWSDDYSDVLSAILRKKFAR